MARVQHCNRLENNQWGVGCAFSKPLSEPELQALLLIGAPSCKATGSYFSRAGRYIWNGLHAMLARSSRMLGLGTTKNLG